MGYAFEQQSSALSEVAIVQYAAWMLVGLIVSVIAGIFIKRWVDRKNQRDIFLRNRSVSGIIRVLDGHKFEIWTKELFLSLGIKAVVVGGSGDHGIDVVIEYNNKKIAVQCKKYWGNKLVGERDLRDLYGVKHADNFDKVVLITTGNFSYPALEWAKGKKDMVLINAKLLERIILNRKILKDML